MISKVTIKNFKRFKAPTEFVLKPEGVTTCRIPHTPHKQRDQTEDFCRKRRVWR
jgi:hypothetical protein